MSTRTRLAVLGAAVLAVGVVTPALAAPGPTVPPVCVRQPLPNPVVPDAQLQVGYCPQ